MKAIVELEAMGYTFTVDGAKLRGACDGDLSDPDRVRALLNYVKRHRDEALRFLLEREQPATWDTVTLSLPGNTPLAVPADPERWERDADGCIIATYTRDELKTAVALVLEQRRHRLEQRLERGLAMMREATGCDDAEVERLLAPWLKLNAEYDYIMQRIAEVSQ